MTAAHLRSLRDMLKQRPLYAMEVFGGLERWFQRRGTLSGARDLGGVGRVGMVKGRSTDMHRV